jgi:hypothetical protein
MKRRILLAVLIGLPFGAGALQVAACGDDKANTSTTEGAGATGATGGGGSGAAAGSTGNQTGGTGGGFDAGMTCDGLECQIPNCGTEDGTTISGLAYAPNGTLPLYNVVVYVPKFPENELEPITPGAACEQCPATIKDVIGTALTDSAGHFVLKNMPAGDNIPLVVQIGKWRRKVILPHVNQCQDNALTDPSLTRLPKNQTEGDLPQLAMVTGGCDPLPCLFRKMGLDDSEFTDPNQAGKMKVFQGNGGATVDNGVAPAPDIALWASQAQLMPYDIVLLSCECDEYNQNKTPEMKGFMRDYLNSGGRMFATHYHYTWFKNGPSEFQAIAQWANTFTTNPYKINTGFPKGIAFLEWLTNFGSVVGDTINLTDIREDVGTISPQALAWIYKGPPEGPSVKYFTFNTPLFAMPDMQCGRGVFSDIHVSSGFVSNVPSGCDQNPLTDQEKALIFLFFDLAACITPDDEPPAPPLPE